MARDSPFRAMVNKSFVAIDFETATCDRMACQVGIVIVKNGVIVEKISRLIQPPHNKFDDNCIRVHHITPQMTENEPTFDIVWEQIKGYLTGSQVVAHNARFDYDVLMKNLDYYGILPLGVEPFIDTMWIYNGLGLEDICQAFDMCIEGHHDACFDAECCAKFYLFHLNGVTPDWNKVKSKKKTKSNTNKQYHEQLCGNVLEKDLSNADPNNPFYDRKVVITGEFYIQRKVLGEMLKKMGADIDTSISKKTDFVLIGVDPGEKKLQQIEKLNHDGYNVRKLYEKDLKAILDGDWLAYKKDGSAVKELVFTMDHFNKHHLQFDGLRNIIARKCLFYGKGFRGNFDLFNQITGNLGAEGDLLIYPETSICVLSDSTIEKLSNGERDETIQYIQDYYNSNKAVVFDFDFLTESDILTYCKKRCDACDDDVTLELYEKYMASAEVNVTNENDDDIFKNGENVVQIKGKYYIKLSDGRAWCPSRQFR